MSDDQRESAPPDERHEEERAPGGARWDARPLDSEAAEPVPLPGRPRPADPSTVPLPRERRLPESWSERSEGDAPPAAAEENRVPLPRVPPPPGSEAADLERTVPLPGPPHDREKTEALPGGEREWERTVPLPGQVTEGARGGERTVPLPGDVPLPGGPRRPEAEPPGAPPPRDPDEVARWRPEAAPAPATPEPAQPSPPPPPAEPPPRREPPRELDVAHLAAAARARADEETRSYRGLVDDVERYLADGYELFGMVGYPQSGKTHALQALSKVLHGFDAPARARFRQERAPGPSERWPFYYAFDDGRRRWVFMDVGGELYANLHSNKWEDIDATAGILHTVAHCRGLLLLLHLSEGHLRHRASGFARGMSEAELKAERTAQQAQEELEFFDQFLLFARALRREKGDLAALLERTAAAPLADTLRSYETSPRLEVPVAVLFTQADKLRQGGDFAAGEDEWSDPLTVHGVAPFVGRNLPTLLASLLRHARRFRFDFAQSYVERPGPDEGQPVWSFRNEPLSVGLLPAVEFLERNLPPETDRRRPWQRALETRSALKLHRLLHPRLWRDVEVEL